MIGRFAPSPTGVLHLGNLRTAVLAWLFARSAGSRFLMRMEDLDTGRVRPGLDEQQLADLAAVGVDWDGPVEYQSRRLAGSNCARARSIVDQFNCSEVYVYAMGQEPWLNYIMSIKYTEQSNPIIASNRLVKDCLSRGIVAERLFGTKELVYC